MLPSRKDCMFHSQMTTASRKRVLPTPPRPPCPPAARKPPTNLRASPPKQRNQRGEQEPGRLPRPRLRTRHQVAVGNPDGDRVLLHGGGLRVPAKGGGAHEVLPEHVHLEALDRIRDVLSGGLYGDVVVLVHVGKAGVGVRARVEGGGVGGGKGGDGGSGGGSLGEVPDHNGKNTYHPQSCACASSVRSGCNSDFVFLTYGGGISCMRTYIKPGVVRTYPRPKYEFRRNP